MSVDYLHQAALAFQSLLLVQYRIVLGRAGRSFTLTISFNEDNFFHLTGLHKMRSYHFGRLSRTQIFNDILHSKISDSTVGNYQTAPDILKRIKVLTQLENLLDDVRTLFFKYDARKVRFSNLSADYMAKGTVDNSDVIFSFFVIQPELQGDAVVSCYVNSVFPLSCYDFSLKQTQYTVLLKEKITAGVVTELHRHKNYRTA